MTAYRSSGVPSCKICAVAVPEGTGLLSSAGDWVCRSCFYAEQQRGLDGRAQASLERMTQSAGGVHALSNAGQDGRQVDARARVTRRCARCSAPSVGVEEITVHFRSGLPIGRTYRHRCSACGRGFSTQSPFRILLETGSASLLILVGLLGLTGSSGRWLAVVGLLGLAVLARTVWGATQLVRNPPV